MSSHPSFSSVENKRLIWSSLVESAYFKGFPANQKDMVKRVLDSVVHEVSQSPTTSSLPVPEKNREVVKQMVSYRDLWAQDGTIGDQKSSSGQWQQQQHPRQQHRYSHGAESHGYVSQVTAEELREQREKAFNKSLMEKQAEMEGYLNGSRPQDIDFSDNTQEQRIGGDMERLVAEAEAERRRQMDGLFSEGPSGNKEAEKWVNGGRPLKIDDGETLPIESQIIPSPRRVRFSDEGPRGGSRVGASDADIFAKLKRRPASPPVGEGRGNQDRQSYEAILSEMKEMRAQIAKMGKDIETLLGMRSRNQDDQEHSIPVV